MKPKLVGESRRSPSLDPLFLQHMSAQRASTFAPEHAALRVLRGERVEVRLDFGEEELRECDRAPARVALRRADDQFAVLELMLLLLDGEQTAENVDVSAFETEEFSQPEATEPGEQNDKP